MRQPIGFGILLVLSVGLAGCSCSEKGNPNGFGGECLGGIDFDGDGYGDGCTAGPDCNDADPNYNVDCCYGGNEFTGCPCAAGQVVDCFDGDDSLIGVGACTSGTRTCFEGTWSSCEGGVAPVTERCDNGIDNDCDGSADEGLISACGNCTPGCDEGSFGGDDPLATEDEDPDNVDQDGTGRNDDGNIVLDAGSIRAYFLWIANDNEGTVSKVDTRSGKEVARYPSVVKSFGRLVAGNCGNQTCQDGVVNTDGFVPDWNEPSLGGPATADPNDGAGYLPTTGTSRNRPSRTAIDGFDDCWVANRAHGVGPTNTQQSSVSKIINNTGVDLEDVANIANPIPAAASSCIDFNGDGVITTSRDLNQNGVIDLLPKSGPDQEFFPDDECVAATVMVGDYTQSVGARALAVDAGAYNVDYGGPDPNDPGRAWIGMWSEQAFYRLDLSFQGLTPVANAIRVPPDPNDVLPGNGQMNPYGAAIDGNGVVWAVDHAIDRTQLVGVRSDSQDFSNAALTYVDDPDTGNDYHLGPADGQNYGIVIDLNDKVWVAGYTDDTIDTPVYRYDPVLGTTDGFTAFNHKALVDGDGPSRGLAIDLNGYVYTALSTTPGRFVRFKADGTGAASDMKVFVYGNQGDGGNGPIGIGFDFDGQLWVINRATDNASKIDIDTTQDLDSDGVIGDPVGGPTNLTVTATQVGNAPYTYSDFTGLSLRNVVRPNGTYAQIVQGCPNGEADWLGMTFDAETPVGTQIQVCVRTGNDPATIRFQQPCYGTWTTSPIDFEVPVPSDMVSIVPNSEYLYVQFTLISIDRATTPVLKGFDIQWSCPSQIE